jgi:hypothetical protein
MEAAHALAELLAASPQVVAATVFDDNEPLESAGVSDWQATAAVGAGRTLLDNASAFRGVGEATQVYASLANGDVFVVGNLYGPSILAVTAPRQPAGLIFHELKRCLAAIVEAQDESRSEVRE